MKYWGRKPHNIWSDYIDHYCPKDGIVLDPFMGSGTTAVVAKKLNRQYLGYETMPEYCEIANNRLAKVGVNNDN